MMGTKILAVSDEVIPTIESPCILERYKDVEMVFGCGDLPYTYMEYIATMLHVPCLFVHGNHDHPQYLDNGVILNAPGGWVNLDSRTVKVKGWIIGGLEGARRYRPEAPYQYTEGELRVKVKRMLLSLLANRVFAGRYIDILITHAPPYGIHDTEALSHRGFETLLEFMQRFRPRYLLHGHFHRYGTSAWRTRHNNTEVINVYPSRVIELRDHDGGTFC